MAQRPLSDLIRNPLTRAAAVTIGVLVFFGAASGALPMRCLTDGFDACAPKPAPTAAKVASNAGPKAVPHVVDVASADAPAKGPTLTNNDLIATTFALLPSKLEAPATDSKSFASTAIKPEADAPLASRVVKTLSVDAQGQPRLPDSVAVAYADARGAPSIAPLTPAVDAATTEAQAIVADALLPSDTQVASDAPASDPAASSEPSSTDTAVASASEPAADPATATDAPAPTDGSLATVTGSGANVRSSPAKGGSKVLFALKGGARVTVGESRRGWLHITDETGRSGWIYKDYLQR